jgi:protein required for attachment to host cells
MRDTWILVADHARARLFSLGKGTPHLTETENFVNPAARTPGRKREHAPPPRTHDRFGNARHVIEPRTSPRDKLAARFAASLASALKAGWNAGGFRQLVLIAPPRFLGVLDAALDARLRESVVLKVARNLTRRSPATILAELPKRFVGRGPLSPPGESASAR